LVSVEQNAASKWYINNVKTQKKAIPFLSVQSKSSSDFGYSRNRFQTLVQRLNLNDKQNQLFYDFCLSILSCLSGVLTTLIVILGRRSISFLDWKFRSPRPVLFPVIGSAIVCIFYYLDTRVGSSPFSSEYHRAHLSGKSALNHDVHVGHNSSIQLPANKTIVKDVSELKFSAIRQIIRLFAVIVTIGSGCSLG